MSGIEIRKLVTIVEETRIARQARTSRRRRARPLPWR